MLYKSLTLENKTHYILMGSQVGRLLLPMVVAKQQNHRRCNIFSYTRQFIQNSRCLCMYLCVWTYIDWLVFTLYSMF